MASGEWGSLRGSGVGVELDNPPDLYYPLKEKGELNREIGKKGDQK